MAQQEFTQHFPKPGWVEHDPLEIWETQKKVMLQAMEKLQITAKQVAGIGITNQRETAILWEKESGKPICNAIVWQCRRTAKMCDELKEKGYEEMIRRKTGLPIDPYFSGKQDSLDAGFCRRCKRKGRERGNPFRNGGNLADLESDRRRSSCNGLYQRFQNDAL